MINRNYGIDLLRILSMYMVIVLHIIGSGGAGASALNVASLEGVLVSLVYLMSYGAVNMYGMVSGYVGVKTDYKYSNLIILWIRVFFYSVLISTIVKLLNPETIDLKTYFKAYLPVGMGQYWYFTAYVGLFILIPILNAALNNLTKEQHKVLIITIIVMFSCYGIILRHELFGINSGYSVIWLVLMYILGAYIRLYNPFGNWNYKKALAAYFSCILFILLQKTFSESVLLHYIGVPKGDWMFIGYNSPFIIMAAYFMVVAFSKMQLGEMTIKLVKMVSPLAFSVYLIHNNPQFRAVYWDEKFKWITTWSGHNAIITVACILACALLVFGICILIDFIRESVFVFFGIPDNVKKIEQKCKRNVW